MLYQPPLTRDHLWGRHMYLIQPTTMSVFHVNSQMPMQWEDTAFFFYFKICIYIYYASKNDSTIFFSNLLSTYLELDPFNWPTLPLIFFFPHALTTGSRFVSQREALYQEEGSFLTWMNSLTKLEANQQHILFIFYQLFLLHRIHTWGSQNSPLKARLVGR